MKAVIDKVKFHKEVTTKVGTMYSFKVEYNNKFGSYLSKSKDQNHFIEGQECEFTEVEKTWNGTIYYDLKPVKQSTNSAYTKAVKKEQSRYSGFAVSYAKDLVVAGRLNREELVEYATVLFDAMVSMDKTLEQ